MTDLVRMAELQLIEDLEHLERMYRLHRTTPCIDHASSSKWLRARALELLETARKQRFNRRCRRMMGCRVEPYPPFVLYP